jgi:acetyl-CoA carboxylase, biotin carboxylase subunit
MNKILIANRGEIAVRVMRACRDMGIRTVAVHSECDRAAPHVRYADEAWPIGPNPPGESYLRIDRIVEVARRSGADAVHPGYGFLSENEDFAAACEEARITFIGPTAEAIARMGNKTEARHVAIRAGVPVVPGTEDPLDASVTDDEVARIAEGIGYPLLVKAVAGGGGKGMRVVATAAELPEALRTARSEAGSAFGDSTVYLERKLLRPRHIEFQLLGDHHGTVVPFVERECSIQRRHQKVIEETPSPVVQADLRAELGSAAAAVARSVGYTGAGTIEFLMDESGQFYFLEMNTRIQVEHPITEMVTGVDLVQWQIRIARGEHLDIEPLAALTPQGHAIECRIYAEDPEAGFMPSPGRITALRTPSGPWIRDDSSAEAGMEVSIFYDPLISKLAVWGPTREDATARMRRALGEYEVLGIRTTVPFFQWMLGRAEFESATFHTGFLDEVLQRQQGRPFIAATEEQEDVAAIAAALHEISGGPAYSHRTPAPAVAPTPSSAAALAASGGSRRVGWKRQARIEALRT